MTIHIFKDKFEENYLLDNFYLFLAYLQYFSLQDAGSVSLYPYYQSQILQYVKENFIN